MDESLIEEYKNEMLKMYREHVNSSKGDVSENSIGRLIVTVTSVSYLYPVPYANVTVFTGAYENMNVIATDTASRSGVTKPFELYTPPKGLSLDSGSTEVAYSLYNLLIEAEGYVSNVHLNIPIFGGVTSLQRSNLLLLSAAGDNTGPIIYNEASSFEL